MKHSIFPMFLVLLFAVSAPLQAASEVNVYSARIEALIKPLLDRFTEETGIRVNLVTGSADALLQRLIREGRNTPADLFLTTDAGRLIRAKEAGMLQTIASERLDEVIPAHYRDDEGMWYGLSMRARFLVYAPDRVDVSGLESYADLADPKWRNKICVRSSDNVYNQSLTAALLAHQGEQVTESWARGLVANFARRPSGGDRDQITATAVGQCDIAMVNTYYLAMMLAGSDANQRQMAEKLQVLWPDQEGNGTHVNISGAGVVHTARNRDAAVQLLEFLVSDESQRWYAETNHEYPIKEGIALSPVLESWGEFTADQLPLHLLGKHNADAVRLMDRAGWQ